MGAESPAAARGSSTRSSEFVRAHAHAAHIAPATASPVSESRLVIPYSVCFIWLVLFTMLYTPFYPRGSDVCVQYAVRYSTHYTHGYFAFSRWFSHTDG